MPDEVTEQPGRQFHFIRSGDNPTPPLAWGQGQEQVRKALGEALNARNVAFLLGAGCSSFMGDGKERGISTMAPLVKEFCSHPIGELDDDLNLVVPPAWALDKDDVDYLAKLGAKVVARE